MGNDRGSFAPTTLRCRFVVLAPVRPRVNVVQREATERPNRARHNRGLDPRLIGAGNPRPGQAPRVANLEDVYYQERTAIQFEGTGIAAATAGIYSRCHRLLVVRIAD